MVDAHKWTGLGLFHHSAETLACSTVSVGNPALEVTFQITVNDVTSPNVALASTVGADHNDSFIAVAQFSEDVIGFDVSDITVTNGYVENFQAGTSNSYNFIVVPVVERTDRQHCASCRR